MTNPTQPSQAARDAAVPFVAGHYTKKGGYSDEYWVRNGQYDDHPLVQAFARFEHDTEKRVRESLAGWIVTSGDGKRFRCWKDGWSAWTEKPEEATRYARREDAEAVHAEDEDAWRVILFAPASLAGEANVERVEEIVPLELLPRTARNRFGQVAKLWTTAGLERQLFARHPTQEQG